MPSSGWCNCAPFKFCWRSYTVCDFKTACMSPGRQDVAGRHDGHMDGLRQCCWSCRFSVRLDVTRAARNTVQRDSASESPALNTNRHTNIESRHNRQKHRCKRAINHLRYLSPQLLSLPWLLAVVVCLFDCLFMTWNKIWNVEFACRASGVKCPFPKLDNLCVGASKFS